MRATFPPPAHAVERQLPRPEFRALFREAAATVQRRVIKVETRQAYAEDDLSGLYAYQRGDLARMYELMRERKPRYAESMRTFTARSVEFRRLRVVEQPFTDYLRWELEHLKEVNAPAGERIFVVERSRVAALADEVALDDYILFDDQLAFANIYSRPEGVPGGANLIKDPSFLSGLMEMAEVLSAAAVPFADFPLPAMARPARAPAG